MNNISIKKASILIWSIFLLLFLSTSFIYISTKIGKSMTNSEELFATWSSKYDFINWNNSIESEISWAEKYQYFNNSIYTWVLRNAESKTFTWIYQTINLNILPLWWTWSIYFSWNSQTWITNTWFSLNYTNTWNLTITNTWWFTNYTINLANTSYEIYTEIWGKKFIKEKWEK